MSGTRPQQAVLFGNARSGRSRRWLFRLAEACEQSGIALTAVHIALRADRIEQALTRAREDGVRTVLAAGGDGTIGTLAGHVINSEFALGVLPAGTSNDFARSLCIPMSVEGSVDVVARGRTTCVDVGDVNGRVFVHAAIVGINCQFARRAEALRPYLGRLSYPLASLWVYRDRKPFNATLIASGEARTFHAYELAFINSPVYGGALGLEAPDAGLTDHKLSIIAVEDLRLRTIVKGLALTIQKKQLHLKGIETWQATRAELSTDTPLDITADGEVCANTPASISIIPAALRVFVPDDFFLREDALTR